MSGDGRCKPRSKPEAGGERPAKAGDEQYTSPGRCMREIWGGQRFFTPTCPLKIPSSHSPEIFLDSKHVLSYSERAEPRQAATPCPAIV